MSTVIDGTRSAKAVTVKYTILTLIFHPYSSNAYENSTERNKTDIPKIAQTCKTYTKNNTTPIAIH